MRSRGRGRRPSAFFGKVLCITVSAWRKSGYKRPRIPKPAAPVWRSWRESIQRWPLRSQKIQERPRVYSPGLENRRGRYDPTPLAPALELALIENPNLGKQDLFELGSRYPQKMLENPSASEALVGTLLCSMFSEVWLALAQNPGVPEDALAQLAKGSPRPP